MTYQQNKIIPLILLMCFLVLAVKNAWVCDDAYITMRTVDNFVHGWGLTWNISERVQTYTHPLWMFLLIIPYAVFQEGYFTLIVLGLVLSGIAFYIVVYRNAISIPSCIIAGLVLLFSKAYIDFSTSGLENPLAFLLLGVFIHCLYKNESQKHPQFVFRSTLFFSLLLLTRLDLLFLVFPAYLYGMGRVWYQASARTRRLLGEIALGGMPFVMWEIFSLIYYGFPVPNTAYAKLHTGIAAQSYLLQGMTYFLKTFEMDPVTTVAIIFSVFFCWTSHKGLPFSLGIGIFAHLLYVLGIGGDFMGTRFLSLPLFVSAFVLSKTRYHHLQFFFIGIVITIFGLNTAFHPFRNGNDGRWQNSVLNNGITDERECYYAQTGLLNWTKKNNAPNHNWYHEGLATAFESKNRNKKQIVVRRAIGMFGYGAGPNVHIIDTLALADPLLARLPVIDTVNWRIGHFERAIPYGYIDSIETGKNHFRRYALREFYRRLQMVVAGDIYDLNRFYEIFRFNCGDNEYLLSFETVRFWESENFEHAIGSRQDAAPEDISPTILSVSEPETSGFLVKGNDIRLPQGQYVAVFRLDAAYSGSKPICEIQVSSQNGKTILSRKVLSEKDFKGTDPKWKYFELPFRIASFEAKNIELRVFYLGHGRLSFDTGEILIKKGGLSFQSHKTE